MSMQAFQAAQLPAPDVGSPRPGSPFLSIVIPALNEEGNVPVLVRELQRVLARVTDRYEVVFVTDGGDRQTCAVVKDLHAIDRRIKLLHLSRSFGHQAAILAGLDHVQGRVVVTMDADLQHPPKAIPELLGRWQEGADVVHTVRRPSRRGNLLIRQCRRIGYGLLERLCEVNIIPQSADFRLYDRRAVQAMRALREQNRFNRGLARWIGFEQAVVPIDEDERHEGRSNYSFLQLVRLLMNGVFSLSSRPLQYLGVAGLALGVLAAAYLGIILVGFLLDLPGFRAVGGWTSTIAVILGMGGIQLTALWLMAQYLARTYDEVKRRPSYLVAEAVGITCDLLTNSNSEPRTISGIGDSRSSPPFSPDTEPEAHVREP